MPPSPLYQIGNFCFIVNDPYFIRRIKAFEGTAKKYGINFALKKDATENPPRYLVFFKGRDADVLTAAFSSIAPSFHPADLLIGIAGAVIVRLIIYLS